MCETNSDIWNLKKLLLSFIGILQQNFLEKCGASRLNIQTYCNFSLLAAGIEQNVVLILNRFRSILSLQKPVQKTESVFAQKLIGVVQKQKTLYPLYYLHLNTKTKMGVCRCLISGLKFPITCRCNIFLKFPEHYKI